MKKLLENVKLQKTLTKALIILAAFLFCFITAMIIIFCIKGSTPDTLISCVLGTGMGELIVTGVIEIIKIIFSDHGGNEQ